MRPKSMIHNTGRLKNLQIYSKMIGIRNSFYSNSEMKSAPPRGKSPSSPNTQAQERGQGQTVYKDSIHGNNSGNKWGDRRQRHLTSLCNNNPGGQVLFSKKGVSDIGHASVTDFRRNFATPRAGNRAPQVQGCLSHRWGSSRGTEITAVEHTPSVPPAPRRNSQERVTQSLPLHLPSLMGPDLETFSLETFRKCPQDAGRIKW